MTVIVGLTHNGRTLIGGDSAGISGWDLTIRADPKVITNGPYIIGYTTSFRMGQILRHTTNLPTPPDNPDDIPRHMATTWIDAVRKELKDAGWAKKDSEREEGGTFLVGVSGRLFKIEDDYQVGEPADGYAAVGCGAPIARGVMYATRKMAPEKRVKLALAAAEHHSAGVRRPFTLLWSDEGA